MTQPIGEPDLYTFRRKNQSNNSSMKFSPLSSFNYSDQIYTKKPEEGQSEEVASLKLELASLRKQLQTDKVKFYDETEHLKASLFSAYSSAREQAENELKAAKQALRKASTEAQGVNQSLKDTQEAFFDQKLLQCEEISTLNDEKLRLQKELESVKEKFAILNEKELKNLRLDAKNAKKRHSKEVNRLLYSIDSEKAEIRRKLQAKNSLVEELNAEFGKAKLQYETFSRCLQESVESLKQSLTENKSELANSQIEADKLLTQKETAEEELTFLQKETKDLEKQLERHTKVNHRLRDKLCRLEKLVYSKTKYKYAK